ncbi:5-oxoprolinase subunit PxpA [Arcobacter sp.]|uniref:5-oxoprolinase subunit PxpA n=1 Tax=unclassified Arcobacter TaxID=2593671 RepID=UPI003B00D95D
MNIKLNCDVGDSFGIWKMGNDEEIMPYINMANLACGFHAGDALNMEKAVSLAVKYNVQMGAHIAYQDLSGFGRRKIVYSLEEILAIVIYQMGALNAFCKIYGKSISYVKPHGSLFNDMMDDESIFKSILSAISAYDKNIKLVILSSQKNEKYKQIALLYGISLILEVYVDRNYHDEGFILSRSEKDSFINDELDIIQRVETLKERGYITSKNGIKLFLQADTICLHGSSEKNYKFIKVVSGLLNN